MSARTHIALGELVTSVISGVSPVCEERPPESDEFGVLTLAAITKGTVDRSNAKAIHADLVKQEWPTLKRGSLLVARASGSQSLVGACALVPEDDSRRIIPDTAWVLTTRHDCCVSTRWIAEFLRSSNGRRAIHNIARGTSGIWKINKASFGNILVPIANARYVQRADLIALQMDRIVCLMESSIEALRRQNRGLLHDLIVSRRQAEHHDGKLVPLGRLSEHAHERTERNHGAFGPERVMGVMKGLGLTPMRERVRATVLDRYKIVVPDAFAYNPMRLNIGSIARNKCGEKCLVSPDYVVFETDRDTLLPAYLDHVRHSSIWNRFVRATGTGSVRVRIYFDDLAAMRIPLPSIAEQTRIAHALNVLDREIGLLEQLRTAYQAQKRGLMQRVFAGDLAKLDPAA